MIEQVAIWLDERLSASEFLNEKAKKVFPHNWSFLLGEIAADAFIVLVVTGTFLALFFEPSHAETMYHGSYLPLHDVKMTAAYESTIKMSFDVRAGLFMRQIHHWAALLFLLAIVMHLSRVFFTGAFRRPREINWLIGVTLLVTGVVEGFAGYSLPDDLLSGTGLRVFYAIAESIPLIGPWMASFIFGGMFPGEQILPRLYIGHVFVIPGLLGALIGAHIAIILRQTHTQFPGPGRREDNVVGVRLYPTYATLAGGLFFLVFAFTALLGGLVQINPIWFYGPYDPFAVSIGSQPDWYMGWVEGAMRLLPAWELRGFGYLIPQTFFSAALFPLLAILLLYAYPWIEARFTGDRAEHHVLDRARDRPMRTAIGAAALTFAFVLTIAAADDMIAVLTRVSISRVIWALRFGALILPPLVAWVVFKWCKDLAGSKKRPPARATEPVVPERVMEEERRSAPSRDYREAPAFSGWRLG